MYMYTYILRINHLFANYYQISYDITCNYFMYHVTCTCNNYIYSYNNYCLKSRPLDVGLISVERLRVNMRPAP